MTLAALSTTPRPTTLSLPRHFQSPCFHTGLKQAEEFLLSLLLVLQLPEERGLVGLLGRGLRLGGGGLEHALLRCRLGPLQDNLDRVPLTDFDGLHDHAQSRSPRAPAFVPKRGTDHSHQVTFLHFARLRGR